MGAIFRLNKTAEAAILSALREFKATRVSYERLEVVDMDIPEEELDYIDYAHDYEGSATTSKDYYENYKEEYKAAINESYNCEQEFDDESAYGDFEYYPTVYFDQVKYSESRFVDDLTQNICSHLFDIKESDLIGFLVDCTDFSNFLGIGLSNEELNDVAIDLVSNLLKEQTFIGKFGREYVYYCLSSFVMKTN